MPLQTHDVLPNAAWELDLINRFLYGVRAVQAMIALGLGGYAGVTEAAEKAARAPEPIFSF